MDRSRTCRTIRGPASRAGLGRAAARRTHAEAHARRGAVIGTRERMSSRQKAVVFIVGLRHATGRGSARLRVEMIRRRLAVVPELVTAVLALGSCSSGPAFTRSTALVPLMECAASRRRRGPPIRPARSVPRSVRVRRRAMAQPISAAPRTRLLAQRSRTATVRSLARPAMSFGLGERQNRVTSSARWRERHGRRQC
jgi:hypothetical protein